MKKILHAGNLILIGFGIMVVFMCYLVFECTQNPSIMVSGNYYEQELKYQDVIDARTNTEPYQDSLTMVRHSNEVVFSIPQALNQHLKKASLQLYNRADDKKDKQIELKKNEEGIYSLNTNEWGQGNYQIKLSIESNDKNYYKEFNY